MKKELVLIFALLHLTSQVFGQASISGVVTDGPDLLPYCNVVLLDLDSTITAGEVTNDEGAFTLQSDTGDYLLMISFVGYINLYQEISLIGDMVLDTIVLTRSGAELKNVIITAQKQLIQRKPDRLIYNLSNSIAGQGTDMSEAIALAPGVTIQNGVVSMIGRGASRVMIDGRILQLEGDDLLNFLSTISSDDVKSIDVISNPPAQYEATGNGGIINIIYKKGRNNSWKNTTSLSYTKNRRAYGSLRNSLQYNVEKHQVTANLNITKGQSWNTEFGGTAFPSASQDWNSVYISTEDLMSGRLAYDYQLNKQNQIGIQYQGSFSNPNVDGSATTRLDIIGSNFDTSFVNDNIDDRERNSHVANIHWISELDSSGTQLSIDGDYFYYQQDANSIFDIGAFEAENQFLGLSRSRSVFSAQNIQNYSFSADMKQSIGSLNLKYGVKHSRNISGSSITNFDRISGESILDTSLSNSFDYKENISAAYVSGTLHLNELWNIAIGVRIEQTSSKGLSITINQEDKRKFTRLFPTLYLGYNPNEKHQYSLSIGGRVNRPSFRDLNPFRTYITNTAYSEGNPFIQPSYTYTFNFNYVYKGKFTTTAYLNHQKNGFGTLFVPFSEGRVLATLRDNFYDASYLGIGEIFSIDISKKWSMQNQVYLMYHHTTLTPLYNAIAQNGMQYYLSNNHSITMGKGWNCQVNTWYNSQAKSNIYNVDRLWNVSIGIKKKFFNDKINVNLQANDIFNQSGLDNLSSNINGVINTYGQNYSSRNIRMTISYNFGNDKINVQERGFKNEDTQRRL